MKNACVQFSVRGDVDALTTEMKSKFFTISQETGIDIACQEENLFYRSRRLVAFDMDSTLIRVEVIGNFLDTHLSFSSIHKFKTYSSFQMNWLNFME